jgi:hypothetical protein
MIEAIQIPIEITLPGRDWWEYLLLAITAFSTPVLVAVTIFYVVETRKTANAAVQTADQAREALEFERARYQADREQLIVSSSPELEVAGSVNLYSEKDGRRLLIVGIKNRGEGTALDIMTEAAVVTSQLPHEPIAMIYPTGPDHESEIPRLTAGRSHQFAVGTVEGNHAAGMIDGGTSLTVRVRWRARSGSPIYQLARFVVRPEHESKSDLPGVEFVVEHYPPPKLVPIFESEEYADGFDETVW